MFYGEDEEVLEMIFIQKGLIAAGFEVNKVKKLYKLQYKRCMTVGEYQVFYQKASEFIYQSCTPCTGFAIRSSNIKRIME